MHTNSLNVAEQLRKKYYFDSRPQADFAQMGPVKTLGDRIFFISKEHHANRDSASFKYDVLYVLDNQLNEIAYFSAKSYEDYCNAYKNDPKQNYKTPENEIKEVLGAEGDKIEILNGNNERVSLDLSTFTRR